MIDPKEIKEDEEELWFHLETVVSNDILNSSLLFRVVVCSIIGPVVTI